MVPASLRKVHIPVISRSPTKPQMLPQCHSTTTSSLAVEPLAATLSKRATVLLLERGGSPYGNPNISSIASFAANLADVSPSSPAQAFVSTDGVFNTRARVLGGGTRAGWDPKLVEESYEWVEKKIVFRPAMLQWQSAVRDGLLEAGVLPDNGYTFEHIYRD
ncbi:hypothetical protein Vadar_034116 [Vaccinium darrowii]|uniref:Uncharacterized protein n=1 Tax=Vaccinium darrowii TaxID=229202 RepID=A0ACB7YST4_9ERIC|nr:hypothetical protein Vadar_034116 [Vaccinium darrowii]